MCCRYAQSVSPVSLSSLCSYVDSFTTSLLSQLYSTRSFSAGIFAFVSWILSAIHTAIHPLYVRKGFMNAVTPLQRKVVNLLFKKRKIQIKNPGPKALGVQKTKLLLWKIWIHPDCCCQRHLSHAHCLVCLKTDMCHKSGNGFLPPESHTVEKFSLKAASQRLCFPPIFHIMCGPIKMHSPSYSTVLGSLPKLMNVRDAGGVKREVGAWGMWVLAHLMRTTDDL